MKNMLVLLTILTMITGCKKDDIIPNHLPGSWQLNKTELYVTGVLQGSAEYNEITTIYQFESCGNENDVSCQMYITEDGENDPHTYLYDQNTGTIILDKNNLYMVDFISESDLILSKEYGENRSIWSFSKER